VSSEMSSWLEQLPVERGIHAFSVRYPDAQCVSRTLTESVTPAQVEQMWHPLFETVKAFHVRRLPVGRLLCKFDNHAVQLTLRPDGMILGILMSRELAETKPPVLNRITAMFQGAMETQASTTDPTSALQY